MNSIQVETAVPSAIQAPVKRGPGRPKSEGPTVISLRAEVKALGGWVRGKACHRMNKAELTSYVAELKAAKTAH
jgi:hypothetical protein